MTNICNYVILKQMGGDIMAFREFDMLYNPIDDIQIGTMESLNNVEDYIDYAINYTIEKQSDNINGNEKYWVKTIYNKFINGDTNIFSSDNNIRDNILGIGSKGFCLILIKDAIEYTAYRQVVKGEVVNQSSEDFICSLITDKLAQDEYHEAIQLVKNRDEYREALINVYTNFKYGQEGKERLTSIVKNSYGINAQKAMECLEFNLGYGIKGESRRK